jgi:hypothetical protein
MKMTIDRIEEGIVVLVSREDKPQKVNVPISLLPPGSREGDIVTMQIGRDDEATAAARERVSSLLGTLKRKHQE